MVLTEYDEKLHEETCYNEGLRDGLQKGLQDGLQKGLQDGLQKGLQDGEEQATISGIINIIISFGCSIEEAMDVLKVSADKRQKYADIVVKQLSSNSYE